MVNNTHICIYIYVCCFPSTEGFKLRLNITYYCGAFTAEYNREPQPPLFVGDPAVLRPTSSVSVPSTSGHKSLRPVISRMQLFSRDASQLEYGNR